MSEAKHTPGPWRVFIAKGGHAIIGIGELTGEGVADCGFGVWRGGSEEAMANARLIAAAPELLEAAQTVLAGLLVRIDAAPSSSKPVFNGIAELHDAINKAAGAA